MDVSLRRVDLVQFRNHRELSVELSPITVLTGENGAGKTAVLEAISYLSVASSWRTEHDTDVVQWGESFCKVQGQRDVIHELVIQRSPMFKRIRVDGVSKRLKDILGVLPTVLFQPEDSLLLYGSPAYRRQLMDRLLAQTHGNYAAALSQYQKVLKQRNRLLKHIQEGKAGIDELEYWDVELDAAAQVIVAARHQFVGQLQQLLPEYYGNLMEGGERAEVTYQMSPHADEPLLHKLRQNRDKELLQGTTLYGPHREDLLFLYHGSPAAESVSRGQGRALIVAVKLIEIAFLHQCTEAKPLLLLDDVFSEFDEVRQKVLLSILPQYQTVLTATHLGQLTKQLPGSCANVHIA